MFKPSIIIFTVLSKAVFLLWIVFVLFVCFVAVLSVPCSLVITCWERACLLALLCIVFSCVSVTPPFGVSGQVCYDIKPIRKEEGKSYWKIPLCDDDATREK